MPDTYTTIKLVHIAGAVLLLGNIIVTAWWKVMADRTGNPSIIAFAQRQVTLTDFAFTAVGVILLVVAGDTLAYSYYEDSWSIRWIWWGRVLIITTGLIWLGVLVPIQVRLARLAKAFADGGPIPPRYWALERAWIGVGTVIIVLPLIAAGVMVLKPT
jgi:uncharacterized membrane protein